jgi:putative addiction module component (TIGR02574 family)
MSSVNEILDQALKLPGEQRAELAQQLLESLEGAEFAPDVADAWQVELQRRLDTIRAGTAKMRPWDDVQRDIETARRARAAT